MVTSKVFNLILIVVLLIGLLFSVWYSFFYEQDHTGWKETYCQVVRVVPGRTGGRKFVYWVNSNEYYGWTGRGYQGSVPGDVYKIMYDPKDPSKYYWFSECSYFLDGEPQEITIGQVKSISKGVKKETLIEYSYLVGGERFIRLQCLPNDFNYEIGKGEKCHVVYSPDNPARSIIVH